MGAKGLLREMKPFLRNVSIANLGRKRVGRDVSALIHSLLGTFCAKIAANPPYWTGFTATFRKTILSLVRSGCAVVVVMDGWRVSSKIANLS